MTPRTYAVTAGHDPVKTGATADGLHEHVLMAELRNIVTHKLELMGHTVRTDGRGLTVIPLTAPQVVRASGASPANAEKYLPFLQGTCKAYDITSPRRIAGFLSQIGHESAGFTSLTENLNYSVEALLTLFGRHRITEDQAKRYGRSYAHPADQAALAEILYGGPWGAKHLGNTQPGDGAKFIGRGLKQLTGRDNYTRCSHAIGEDFVNHPERLLMPVNAALSAGWFWSTNGLNAMADRGDVHAMTKAINGGVNGMDKRASLYAKGMAVFA